MIRLTFKDGRPFVANPELLEGVFPGEGEKETFLKYSGSSNVTVAESYEEVARKVLEWRLAMERYRAALITGKKEIALADYQHLKQLAGLEEQG